MLGNKDGEMSSENWSGYDIAQTPSDTERVLNMQLKLMTDYNYINSFWNPVAGHQLMVTGSHRSSANVVFSFISKALILFNDTHQRLTWWLLPFLYVSAAQSWQVSKSFKSCFLKQDMQIVNLWLKLCFFFF